MGGIIDQGGNGFAFMLAISGNGLHDALGMGGIQGQEGSLIGLLNRLDQVFFQGRIQGVWGIVGCNNPKTRMDDYINTLTRELVKRDVLVLKTGCAAIASASRLAFSASRRCTSLSRNLATFCSSAATT